MGIIFIIVILAIVATMLRASSAEKKSHEIELEDFTRQAVNETALKKTIQAQGINASLRFSTGTASIAVDEEHGKVLVLSDVVPGGTLTFSISDLKSVRLIDHSDDYRHCQEMERLHSGAERKSMYNPSGRFSMRDVKQGHKRFESYRGELIYGLELNRKGEPFLEIPFYRGNGNVYWNEDARLNELKRFAEALEKMAKNA